MKYKFKNYILHYGGNTIHKFWVFCYLSKFCAKLMWRALIHDFSKYGWKESEGFIKTIDQLKDTPYNTPAYHKLMDEIRPSINHHYEKNSHHPEHYKHGILDMDLLDLVEMFFDWKAATKKHSDGSIMRSIANNQDRFNIHYSISEIFRHTVKNKN